jgi:hypothetical protein
MRKKGTIYHGEIQDAKMLKSIGSDIRNLCKYEDEFKPIWAYVVTWYECRPFYTNGDNRYYGAESNFTNTFQLLLVSNATQSFAMYNFISMDWPNNAISRLFSSNYYSSDIETFNSHYYQFIIENKSVRNLTENSNMAKAGRWFISFNNTKCALKY